MQTDVVAEKGRGCNKSSRNNPSVIWKTKGSTAAFYTVGTSVPVCVVEAATAAAQEFVMMGLFGILQALNALVAGAGKPYLSCLATTLQKEDVVVIATTSHLNPPLPGSGKAQHLLRRRLAPPLWTDDRACVAGSACGGLAAHGSFSRPPLLAF